jgi:predicted nucleic acid-binding protein
MKMLIDTNILVYAHNLDSPYRPQSKETIRRAIAGDFTGYLSIQNLVEFFSVITNPKRAPNPLSTSDALKEVRNYLDAAEIEVLYPTSKTAEILVGLVEKYQVSRGDIFDCILVAMMQEYYLEGIYTFDVSSFSRFEGIRALEPKFDESEDAKDTSSL